MSRKRPPSLNQLTDKTNPERDQVRAGREPQQYISVTSMMDDALQSGISPLVQQDEEIPGEDDVLSGGDPDVDPLEVEYSGDEAAGGSNSSPDNNNVDAIGRLYGITQADTNGLVLGDDLIAPRDKHRWENNPASKDK